MIDNLPLRMIVRLFLCLFVMVVALKLNGQFSLGVKASYFLSFSQAKELAYDDAQDFLSHKIRFIEEDVSPVPEIFLQYENDLVYLRCGLAYRKITTRFSYRDFLNMDKEGYSPELKESKNILVPVQAGLKYRNMFFGAGPSLNWTIKENRVFENVFEIEERRRQFSPGYHVAFSIVQNRLVFEVQYEQRFHGVADYLYYRGDSQSFQQQASYVSLGLAYALSIN